MKEPKATDVFAKRLKQAIEAEGLGESALGVKVNRSKAAVNKWTQGKSLPTAETLDKIAEVLRRPVGWFFVDDAQRSQREVDLQAAVEKLREVTEHLDDLTKP